MHKILLLSLAIVFLLSAIDAYAETSNFVLTVNIPTTNFYTNEDVQVGGKVFDAADGTGIKSRITIELSSMDDNLVMDTADLFTESDGTFIHKFRVETTGNFKLTVESTVQESKQTISKNIRVNPPLGFEDAKSRVEFILPVTVAIISGIATTTLSLMNDSFNIEMGRGRLFIAFKFIFISSLTLTPIVFLLFNPQPIGLGSISIERSVGENILWLVNIGGVKIPFHVLILGLLGGYIRYLWDLPRAITNMAAVANPTTAQSTKNIWSTLASNYIIVPCPIVSNCFLFHFIVVRNVKCFDIWSFLYWNWINSRGRYQNYNRKIIE